MKTVVLGGEDWAEVWVMLDDGILVACVHWGGTGRQDGEGLVAGWDICRGEKWETIGAVGDYRRRLRAGGCWTRQSSLR